MTKFQYLKWKLPGSIVKPAVQKRDSRNNVGYLTKRWVISYFIVLSWIFSQDKQTNVRFARKILHLWNKNGCTHLVRYLKEAYLLTQLFVSGNKVNTTNGFPLSLVGGLPRIIPGPFRSKIRLGEPEIIRMVLTSLAVFRIIKIPGNLKLETITGPFTGLTESLPDYEVTRVLRSVFGPKHDLNDLSKPKHLFLNTAGPNSPVSWKGTWLDIKAWSESALLPTLVEFMRESGWAQTAFYTTLMKEIRYCRELGSLKRDLVLGRLSEKEEAAGKIRVFAIADSITQAVLCPLHKYLFSLLRKLETDGTFDQGAPLLRLLDKKAQGEFGSSSFWSYDLSAATDRIPAKLHSQVLRLLFGNAEYGKLWRQLLCNRDWSSLRYTVGQPMGALSSWAMLAITHHTLVAIAARRVGRVEFSSYALLGDDIVIADDSVAHAYHALMTEELGVEINLSKSLVSPTHFEYAKRLVSVGQELTPIGPRNLLIYMRSPYGMVSILRDAISKGYSLDESTWDSMPPLPIYGKRANRNLDWLIKGPFGLVPTEAGLSSRIRLNSALTPVDVDIMSTSIDQVVFNQDLDQWEKSLKTLNEVVRSFELNAPVDTYLSYGRTRDVFDRKELAQGWAELPDFRKYRIADSSLFFLLRETVLGQFDRLLEEKPVRRFIYSGPLVHFNHYRADWMPTVMSYLVSKIYSWERIVPAMDPFKDEEPSLPDREPMRGRKFFRAVQLERVERSKISRRY